MCLAVNGASGKPANLQAATSRPCPVFLPNNYNARKSYPLILGLHSLGSNASSTLARFFGSTIAAQNSGPGCIVLGPSGTLNGSAQPFWDASDPCCRLGFGSPVADTDYLAACITEALATFNIDRRYMIVVGYSNGGFMANTLARCHPELVTHVLSYAGMGLDATRDTGSGPVADSHFCAISTPVHYTHIHGTADATVVYTGDPGPGDTVGGDTPTGPYLSALQSAERWRDANGGTGAFTTYATADLTAGIVGSETNIMAPATSQATNGSVELWEVVGGSHVQGMNTAFIDRIARRIWDNPRV